MLRWGHEPPPRACEPRGRRAKISRRDHDDAAGIEMIAAQRKNLARLWQMLEHVEQNDDVDFTDPLQVRCVRRSVQHVQPGALRMYGGLWRELDPGDVEIACRLLEKESVGASQLEQLAGASIATDEIDAARELAAQHRLGAQIIGVAVGAASGKILLGVVGGRIKCRCFRAAKPTFRALKNVATVDAEAKRMRRRAAAGGARARQRAVSRGDLWLLRLQASLILLERFHHPRAMTPHASALPPHASRCGRRNARRFAIMVCTGWSC